jgi:hypothetical protein
MLDLDKASQGISGELSEEAALGAEADILSKDR